MAVTTKPALADSTLVRNWYIDVDTTPTGSATWVGLGGTIDVDIKTNPGLVDDSDTAGEGANSSIKTTDQWIITITAKRAPLAGDLDAYDPGQEYLRARSLGYGSGATAHVRWYEVNGAGFPLGEAWEGTAVVSYDESNSGLADPRRVQIILTGRGRRTVVSPHPASA